MFGGSTRRTHGYDGWRDWEQEAEDAGDLIAEPPEELQARPWVNEVGGEADRKDAERDSEG